MSEETGKYVFVDEDGPVIEVYDNTDEIDARTFDRETHPDRNDRRNAAEDYARREAARIGCSWGTNY